MKITINSLDNGKFLLKKFNPDSMDFLDWLNHFEYVADIVHIPNDEMGEFLLNVIEPSVLSIIWQKVAPNNPHNLSYESLISHLEELYGFYQGEWAANCRFVYRDQIMDESILHYVHSLKRILSKASPFLIKEASLMIRFINGLKDGRTRRLLRSWNDLTLDKAIIIAAQMEIYQISSKTN